MFILNAHLAVLQHVLGILRPRGTIKNFNSVSFSEDDFFM